MRLFHLFIAALMLASTASAAACHGVGDVHVICKNGTMAPLYVENKGDVETAKPLECCMGGFALDETDSGALPGFTLSAPHIFSHHHAPKPRLDFHTTPRGPPTDRFF